MIRMYYSYIRIAFCVFWFYILIFLFSCALLAVAGEWLIRALMRISKFLGLREFVVAFFTIAIAASLPNLFVGIFSAVQGIPELSFGDIIGGNVIDLTLAVALAILISNSRLETDSKLIRKSALFTAGIAVLPLFLVLDGALSRGDGALLIFVFFFYIYWLFSKEDRFSKVYDNEENSYFGFRGLLKDAGIILLSGAIILAAAGGIVKTASFFASTLGLPLILVGILIISVGNAIPEIYFAVVSARRGQNWMVLGDLMGSVISSATLVLGIVALIHPIIIVNLPAVAIARFFLAVSAVFFFIFIWTGKRICRREAVFLFLLFAAFILIEVMII